jgi:hypothetical protein
MEKTSQRSIHVALIFAGVRFKFAVHTQLETKLEKSQGRPPDGIGRCNKQSELNLLGTYIHILVETLKQGRELRMA